MLRKALDAAEIQQHFPPPVDSETTSLATGNDEYGSLAKTSEGDDESGIEDSTFAFGDDDEEDEEMDLVPRRANALSRIFSRIHGLILAVANVDNLWDSPSHRSRKTWFVVSFWFTMLATAYALERISFKLLVDRTGPFRLFSSVVLTVTHAILLGIGMVISRLYNSTWGRGFKSLGIPLVDVGLMALLDSVHLLLVIISGCHIPPTLIVILVQLTIPLTCLFTQFVHPDGYCRSRRQIDPEATTLLSALQNPPIQGCGGLNVEHVLGSLIITFAVFAGMAPAIICLFKPEFFVAMDVLPIRTALNTIIFTSGCIPAAASQLYKEHIFLQHKQPVDPNHLNLLLSIMQFLFLLIISPLVYGLQGLSGATKGEIWTTLYPSSQISENFKDGVACFLGTLDEDRQDSAYPEDAICDYSFAIVMVHVMSVIAIGIAVDKIVNAGATMFMFRGISAGIVLSVITLYVYDIHDTDFNYGPVIDSLHFVCTLTLILGSEVYHRVSLHGATFETVYPQMENLYDDTD